MSAIRRFPLFLLALLLPASSLAAEVSAPLRPPAIALADQYGTQQTLAFPVKQPTVLVIADRKGSEQVAGWILALKSHSTNRINLRGIADLHGAPGFMHARIRRKFRETLPYPIMLDWSGRVCAELGYQPGAANLLLFDPGGMVRGRFAGPPEGRTRAQVLAAIDDALKGEAARQGNGQPP